MKFPIKLGELPNAKFSLGGTSNSNGTTTASVNLSGSGTFNNTIFTGGLYFSLTGHAGNNKNVPFSFSVNGQSSSQKDVNIYTFRINF